MTTTAHASSHTKLAIDGGPKVRTAPWPARRLFGEEEKQAAVALFDKAIAAGDAFGYGGEEEQAYCKAFADFLGGGYADGVNSGTNAVYVALRALNPEPYTEIIVPAISDPGGVMPVPLINCIPVPADTAPGSFNVGAEQIAARITERTSAIIVAHITGIPVDMDPVMELARKHKLPVIEDCAQAHGAVYKGRMCGTIGDIAAFSTMFGKHYATGGQGGVVFTRSEEMYWRIRRAADRGKPINLPPGSQNQTAQINCNMDELHAAIGRVQLRKLPSILERRRRFARAVADGCRKLKAVRMLDGGPDTQPAYWFLFFRLDLSKLKVDKDTFFKAAAAEGLAGATVSYYSVPMEMEWARQRRVFGSSQLPWSSPLYKGDPDQVYELPNIKATDACTFRMGIHENYGDAEAADVVAILEKVERAYLK